MLLSLSAGVATSVNAHEETGGADILVGDIVIGESEQRFGGLRAYGFGAAEEVVFEVDLGILERYGIGLDDAAVELRASAVFGASVESTSVADGRLRLVFEPNDATDDDVFEVDEFRLTGLDTTHGKPATDLTYEATFSAGEVDVRSFAIIDPDAATPTLDPNPLYTDGPGSHRVWITDIQPAGETVTIELDVSVLESYGIDIDGLAADAASDEATVRSTSVEAGVVTIVAAPDAGAALLDIRIELTGFDTSAVDSDERVIDSAVAYEVDIEGDAANHVEVETFRLVQHPTTHADTVRTTTDGAQGFGPVVAVIALVATGVLAARRS